MKVYKTIHKALPKSTMEAKSGIIKMQQTIETADYGKIKRTDVCNWTSRLCSGKSTKRRIPVGKVNVLIKQKRRERF